MGVAAKLTPLRTASTRSGRPLRFYCPSYDTAMRADTLLTKEPETLTWIDSFTPGDVFWDLGANVGVYSLYAAIERQAKVLAFEPSAANYWVLNRNIQLNHADRQINAYCFALAGGMRLGVFNMADVDPGGACYRFDGSLDEIDYPCVGLRPVMYHQAMISFSIDQFIDCFGPPFPNHVKIDVDGTEEQILSGGVRTLGDPRLKTLLVEVEDKRGQRERIDELTAQAGLTCSGCFAPALAPPDERIVNCVYVRKTVGSHAAEAAT